MEKCIIFGIDGADFFLTRDLMSQGRLPNLSALKKRGVYGCLQSTIPPLTPQAWSSFACSVNPGKHGVFDFGEIPYDSYESRLNTSEDRRTRGFWEYLREEGLSTAVINMPLTYPAEDLGDGYMVSGMHTPDLHSLCYREDVVDFILKECPDTVIDVMSFWYKDMDLFLDRVKDMVLKRTLLARKLRTRFPTDVFFLTYVGLDRVLHALYSQQDFHTGGKGWKYERAATEIFELIDRGIGQILDDVSEEVPVIVLSDHGFGTLERDVYLNNYFQKKGYLDFDPKALAQAMIFHPGWERGTIGSAFLHFLYRFKWFRQNAPWQQKSFSQLDWKKVKCFSTGLFGNVFLHRKDRFSQGWIEAGSDQYYEIRAEVMADLQALRLDGEPLVDEIYLSEEIYHGPFVSKSPDLIVRMKNYAYITRGGEEFHSNAITDFPGVNHSGNHRMEGIFFASGSPYRNLGEVEITALLEDLIPTVFHALDLPVPLGMDGRVLKPILKTEQEPAFYEAHIYREKTTSELQPPEEVLLRLKALGYLGS
jgi:predicted AlkP superfamily phosphohydrolase/phosphomutase